MHDLQTMVRNNHMINEPALQKTCLIVDDSRIVRKVTRRIIQSLGFKCIEAEDGAHALETCLKEMPDIIVIDWQMPNMTGIDFLKTMNTTHTSNMAKVIFCTTENDVRNIREALKNGAAEYIMKPFDSDIMRSKMFFAGVIDTP